MFLCLNHHNFQYGCHYLNLNCLCQGKRIGRLDDASPLYVAMPLTIHREDRRDRLRYMTSGPINLAFDSDIVEHTTRGELIDRGPGGIGVRVREDLPIAPGTRVRIDSPQETHGVVRAAGVESAGWRRIGIEFGLRYSDVPIERRTAVNKQSTRRQRLPYLIDHLQPRHNRAEHGTSSIVQHRLAGLVALDGPKRFDV